MELVKEFFFYFFILRSLKVGDKRRQKMNLKHLRKIKKQYLLKKKLKKNREWLFREENSLMAIIDPPKLTDDELEQIFNIWGTAGMTTALTNEYRIFKKISGFDPNYVPSIFYFPLLIRSLNPTANYSIYENKGLYDLLFKGLKKPKTIVKNIEGNFFEGNSTHISKEEALKIIKKNNEILIKPIVDTFGGKGVKRYIKKQLSEHNLNQILSTYSKNYIVQEVIEQHKNINIFNPSSLNTFRVTSLFLNGRTSVLFTMLRIGSPGQVVDNSSAGGLRIEINSEGLLAKEAFDKKLKKYNTALNGVPFAGKKILHFEKLKKLVLEHHSRYFPTCSLIGWDLAIDKLGDVIFIEANTRMPGIRMGQICCGPLFGERTKEVIDYYQNHPPLL